MPKLVYRIYLSSNHINNNEIGYIDAQNGHVLLTEYSVIRYADIGTFATRYSGTKYGYTQCYEDSFHLADSTRGAIIHTWNLKGSTDIEYREQYRKELSDNDNDWTANEHSSSKNDMGLDIHWALQQIYDYLDSAHKF